ncbi:MAG: hypothetical protein ABL996_23210 [Micropepsaceae bacterium]
MITTYLRSALMVALMCVGISACAFGHYTRGGFFEYNDVLRVRAARIEALLSACTAGPSVTASQANAAAAASSAVAAAAANLVNTPGEHYVEYPEARAQWDPFFAAQLQAYNAALSCGLVSPNAIDPGGWSATWDDISS